MSLSLSIIFGVVPEEMSAWNPEIAPHAMVMKAKGYKGPGMIGPPPAEKAWFLHDGTPYKGEEFRDGKGKPFGEMDVACGKCGGSGKRRFGRRRFGSCQACGGQKTTFEQVRIYTQAEIDRKDAAVQARRATISAREAVKAEAAKGRWHAWCQDNAALVERAREADDEWINGVLLDGEAYGSLTEAQARAIHAKLIEMDEERRACIGSTRVGEPKARGEFEVTCRRRGQFMAKGFGRNRRKMREVYITEMLDRSGNALIAVTENFKLEKGDKALIRATVKEYDEQRKPWTVTVLTRVDILRLDPAPPAPEAADEAGPHAWLYDDELSAPLPPLAPGEEPAECVDHGEGLNLPF